MHQQKLYLIDDSPDDAAMMQRVITKAGWLLDFVWIGDAEAALEHLRELPDNQPDIILLDIKMPKLNGLELIGRLAAENKLRRLPPITVLSSSTLDRDIRKAESFPGVDYQTKPDGYLALKALLHQIIPAKLISLPS